jgi:3-methyladenine DNA glycosylase AlkC
MINMMIVVETKKPEDMASGLDWIRQNISGEYDKKAEAIEKHDAIKDKVKAKKYVEILKGKLFFTWKQRSDFVFEIFIHYAGENLLTNWQIKKSFMETFRQIDAGIREI